MLAELAGQHVDEAAETGLEGEHVVRRGALLRTVDGGRAERAEQRVVHVGGQDDLGLREPCVEPVEVHAGEFGQRGAARVERRARAVEEAGAERGEHARAAVGAGAAAHPEDEGARTGVQRGGDLLAGAVGG